MTKQEKIYDILDKMVIALNEETNRLSKHVAAGQLRNDERWTKFNSYYTKTLNTTAELLSHEKVTTAASERPNTTTEADKNALDAPDAQLEGSDGK